MLVMAERKDVGFRRERRSFTSPAGRKIYMVKGLSAYGSSRTRAPKSLDIPVKRAGGGGFADRL